MENDDELKGRVLSRRQVVRLLTIGSVAAAGGWRGSMLYSLGAQAPSAVPACVVQPELEEGPFFLDRQLDRSDVRMNTVTGALSDGLALALTFAVSDVSGGTCAALAGAVVDIWQCDAHGIYSGVGAPTQPGQTADGKALRGFQTTDSQGRAAFTTVYPGWYQGRTVHIHFKIRTAAATAGTFEFTSQLFFDDALTDQVYAQAPYSARPRRDVLNRNDGIFRQNGSQMILSPVPQGQSLAATFSVGLDLSDAAVGRPDGRAGGGRGSGGARRRGRGAMTSRSASRSGRLV
jgi:protocatechuate 3,4-dioxygenase beta subunit